MYLADCHNHTCCSTDSQATLAEMVAAAAKAGLNMLCTTDHLDLIGHQGKVRDGWNWQPVLDQFAQVRAHCPEGLELRLGIEIGSAQFFPEWSSQLLSQAPLDLVIGSAHNTCLDLGGWDYIEPCYTDETMCRSTLEHYFESMLALAGMEQIDVLGHLPYLLRYMNDRDGNHVTLTDFSNQIEEILCRLISRGAGLEFNTNRARGNMEARWRPILECYHRLGGEIITLGSDAHQPEHVGLGIPEGIELLRSIGFRYYTVYRQRKPEFILL